MTTLRSSPQIDTEFVDSVLHLAKLAMAFGRIDRTGVSHPDGTPESDSDHTVMLGWLACALAERWYPNLDRGLIAQFALVHDAPEVYAGDTPTLRIDAAGLARKAEREHWSVQRLALECARLPWFVRVIVLYEQQELPEARFVCALDKVVTRMVHLIDGGRGLREQGIDHVEWERLSAQTLKRMWPYAQEFMELLALRAELGKRITGTPGLLAPGN